MITRCLGRSIEGEDNRNSLFWPKYLFEIHIYSVIYKNIPRNSENNQVINPLVPGVHQKVTHIYANLQILAAGLFKFVRPFSGHQELKG